MVKSKTMDIENIKKKIKRVYRKDKPKFYAISGGSVVFLILILMTFNKMGNSIDSSHGEQLVIPGQGNSANAARPKNYVSIYEFKAEPLKLNPNWSGKAVNANPGQLQIPNMTPSPNVYKISSPTIDGITLGKNITPEELKKLNFDVGTPQGNLLNARKVGSAYNIYSVDGATFNVLVNNGKITNLIFNWSQVEARVLMKNIMDSHSINLSAVNCAVVNVPESTQPKAKTINTEMCTLRATSQGLSIDVSTLPALKTGTVSFNYIN